MGLLDFIAAQLEVRRFKRSPLGQALRLHTNEFFYSGHTLSWMEEQKKQVLIQNFMGLLVEAQQAANSALALRTKLTEYVLLFSQLQTLCLTEGEKEDQHYSSNPYISGTLHRRILDAAEPSTMLVSGEKPRAVSMMLGLS